MTKVPDAFSNNDAMDFLDIVFGKPTWDVVRDAIASVIRFPGDLDYTDGAYALAGAALVANSLTGKPPVTDSLAGLVAKLGRPPQDLVDMARTAFPAVIRSQTKFAEQALSPNVCAAWLIYVGELRSALERGDP